MASCLDCRFYNAEGAGEGRCNRYAPRPHKQSHRDRYEQPLVPETYSCGDWKPQGLAPSASGWVDASTSDPPAAGWYDVVIAGAVSVREWNGSAWLGIGTISAWR